ncbi:hypothetical protein D1872_302110 [compost metagenome]
MLLSEVNFFITEDTPLDLQFTIGHIDSFDILLLVSLHNIDGITISRLGVIS